MSSSNRSYRPLTEHIKSGHIRMEASIWDRVNEHADKRRISRALIFEAACTEYLDKLDRLDRSIAEKERQDGNNA